MFLRENHWAWAEENEYFWWFVSCFQLLYPSNKQVETCGCCEAVFLISSENHKVSSWRSCDSAKDPYSSLSNSVICGSSGGGGACRRCRAVGCRSVRGLSSSGCCRSTDRPPRSPPGSELQRNYQHRVKQRTSYVGVCRKAATTQQAVGKCSFSPACHQTVACVSGALGPLVEKKRVEDSENEPSALMMWDVVLTIIEPEWVVYYQLNLEPLMLVD